MKNLALSLVVPLALAVAAPASANTDKDVQKSIKVLISSIRYSKDDMASKYVAYDTMVERLLGETWKEATDAEKKELASGMEKLIRGISFPAGRDMFKYLDNVLYDPAKVSGDEARAKSTVVIHRDLKKTEIGIEWVMVNQGGTWKVFDTVLLGESTLAGIREEQIEPLHKQGGLAAIMKALRSKVAEVESKQKKK